MNSAAAIDQLGLQNYLYRFQFVQLIPVFNHAYKAFHTGAGQHFD